VSSAAQAPTPPITSTAITTTVYPTGIRHDHPRNQSPGPGLRGQRRAGITFRMVNIHARRVFHLKPSDALSSPYRLLFAVVPRLMIQPTSSSCDRTRADLQRECAGDVFDQPKLLSQSNSITIDRAAEPPLLAHHLTKIQGTTIFYDQSARTHPSVVGKNNTLTQNLRHWASHSRAPMIYHRLGLDVPWRKRSLLGTDVKLLHMPRKKLGS